MKATLETEGEKTKVVDDNKTVVDDNKTVDKVAELTATILAAK
jgi:hypothetical protein